MPYVKVRELPDTLQSALSSVGYAKGDVQILIQETESLAFAGGDGYRGFASVVNISTGERKEMQGSWGGANPFNPTNMVDLNYEKYPIPKDVAVIRGFTGGASGITHATITLSPQNVMPVLQSTSELGDDEKHLLAIMRGHKPAYRKPYLDAAKEMVETLVERGYISRSKNGALTLTTKGKNACEGVRVSI
jgi:hypothetical protein